MRSSIQGTDADERLVNGIKLNVPNAAPLVEFEIFATGTKAFDESTVEVAARISINGKLSGRRTLNRF